MFESRNLQGKYAKEIRIVAEKRFFAYKMKVDCMEKI